MKKVFNNIQFDDITVDEESEWSQICKACVNKNGIEERYLDEVGDAGTCGVEGCENESEYYIDFWE